MDLPQLERRATPLLRAFDFLVGCVGQVLRRQVVELVGATPEEAGATLASAEGCRCSASCGGGPPHVSTSGHKSAPFGHTTVPPSARTIRKLAGSRFARSLETATS